MQALYHFSHSTSPGLGFELRLHTCKAGVLLLEPLLQSILLWLLWRWESHELFAQGGLELKSSRSQLPK
jgi:hypothetical protein